MVRWKWALAAAGLVGVVAAGVVAIDFPVETPHEHPAQRPAARRPGSPLVAQARELVDSYFGDRSILDQAASLLVRAHAEEPQDPNVYIEAARVTVKGGFLSFDNFRAGSVERYGALLDKAIALDPSSAKAHILKANFFKIQGRVSDELAELEKAQDLGTDDPWLWVGYGQYYSQVFEDDKALEMLTRVEKRGRGTTPSERNAYIVALWMIADIDVDDEATVDRLRRYGQIVLRERAPADAWSPLNFAERFFDNGEFGDAITYARESLKTMDFGAGRLTLAAALCAQIAKARESGKPPMELQPLVKEVRGLGISQAQVSGYLVERQAEKNLAWMQRYLPDILPGADDGADGMRLRPPPALRL